MGRSPFVCTNLDGPSILFEPSTVIQLGPQSLSFEELSSTEHVTCSGPVSPQLQTLSLHDCDPDAPAMVDGPSDSASLPRSFVASFRTQIQPPLLSTRRLRSTRAPFTNDDDDSFVPKRSAHLAAKSKFQAAKLEAQEHKVMMKKLGFDMPTEVPDEASFEEFQAALARPLTPSKQEAMHALFLGRKQLALCAVRAA